MKLLLLPFSLICYIPVAGQQITGTWEGKMYDPYSKGDTVLVEVEIRGKTNKNLSGNSMCRFKTGYYAQAAIAGKYDSVKKELYLQERFIESTNMPEFSALFLDEYYLNFDQEGKLSGIVRCKGLAHNDSRIRMPCHDNMYMDLIRKQ